MPNETDLRDAFAAGPSHRTTVNAKTVIARSKRRRLPRQIGTGSVFTLAAAGIAVGGVSAFSNSSVPAATTNASASQAEASSSDTTVDVSSLPQHAGKRIPAEGINACGQQLAVRDAAANGLVLTAHFPYANATTGPVEGTVTLTNTGDTTVDGWSIDPTITLSQNGLVLWHGTNLSNEAGVQTHLEPGESVDFATSFEPVVCSADDETGSTLPSNLPAAPAGEYQVSAAMDISGDAYDAILVTGPAQTITLR